MPLALFAFAALAVQAQAITMSVDPGKLVLGGLLALVTGLFSVVTWFFKRMVAKNDGTMRDQTTAINALGVTVEKHGRETQAIRQELVGLDGRNGIKGTQKEHGRQLRRLSVITAALAQAADLQLPDEEEVE